MDGVQRSHVPFLFGAKDTAISRPEVKTQFSGPHLASAQGGFEGAVRERAQTMRLPIAFFTLFVQASSRDDKVVG
jgi:hypothetical protein